MQSAMTDISNIHTCSISRMNLITARMFAVNSQLLKFASDVIRGTGVEVPICVDAVGGCGRGD